MSSSDSRDQPRHDRSRNLGNDALPSQPQETHPFYHLGLGELPWLIFFQYPRGSKDRGRVVQLLREHACKNSCVVNHLSGEYDLAVWIWLPAGKLKSILNLVEAALGSAKSLVFPIQKLSTPMQRGHDEPGVHPILFDYFLKLKGQLWTPLPWTCGLRGLDVSGFLKFYTIIETQSGQSTRVFKKLVDWFSREGDAKFSHYEHHTLCTYQSPMQEGCIISAYTTSWERTEYALLELLDLLPDGVHPMTYLCFKAQIDNDLPWLESREGENAPSLDSLKKRAMRSLTGTYNLREQDVLRAALPSVETLFSDEAITRSVLTYDHEYWWDFIADIKSLVQDIVTGTGERFAEILLKQYVRIDRQLCFAVRRLFALPAVKKGKAWTDEEKEKDKLIIQGIARECGLADHNFEQYAVQLSRALQRIVEEESLDAPVKRDLQAWIGAPMEQFKKLSEKGGLLTLGWISEIIVKIGDGGLLPKKYQKCLKFDGNPLMEGWQDNLKAVSKDRDLLAHGRVTNARDLDENEQEYWERLLPNYIKAFPQVKILLRALLQVYNKRCRDHPIKLSIKPPQADSKARRKRGRRGGESL